MMKIKSELNDSLFPIILILFAALVWRSTYYIYSLYVAIPLIILYCFYYYNRVIFKSKYFSSYAFIIIWMLFSSCYNVNYDISMRHMIPILASFLFSMAIYSITYKSNKRFLVLFTYVALFAYLMAQNFLSDSFTMSFDYSNELERNSNFVLNTNEYAYYSLFAIMGWRLALLLWKQETKKIFLLVLYLASFIMIIFVALLTASRQVMLLEIPLLSFFVYLDFIRGSKNQYMLLLFIVLIILAFPYINQIYENSYLSQRSEVSFQEDTRGRIFWLAIEQGLENPFLGIGLGAKSFFSHNTYTHILARTGFPSLIAFLYIMVSCVFLQLKRYKRTKLNNFLFYFGCLFILSVGHFTYSYFNEPFMMAIIFAIIACSDYDNIRIRHEKYK